MSGEYPFSTKIVSPAKCNEKPWDSWIGEIGHLSPRPDDDAFLAPPPAEGKGGASRRGHDAHPYKGERGAAARRRPRRSGLHRLRHNSMSLHGLFPQMDNLNAAVCHMCGVIVKCSAAHRHLVEAHAGAEPLLPPPPSPFVKSGRSRHKKEQLPPSPLESLPVKREVSPAHMTPPLSRIALPQQELQYLEEPNPVVSGEVQVCVESGELPVVSIQDTEDLPLGENLTDDIFAIMNSEGIQSADDITNSADWKNIIRDIGNLQDFTQGGEGAPPAELYAGALHAPLASYVSEAELASLQLQPPELQLPPPEVPPVVPRVVPAVTAARHSRKSTKTKPNLREYDPNKHCGVLTADMKPCTRSLTCKAHALSLRRLVEGRAKSFDTLLAEHRASKDASVSAAAAAAAAAAAPVAPPPPVALPPLLVDSQLELSAFNGLSGEQQVEDIYASLLSGEEAVLPDTSSITSLLSQPMELVLPDEAELPTVPMISIASPERATRPSARAEPPPALVPGDVCWYAACPRPLALCTYNASHAGGAVTLGKRTATVRTNIKSSLSRSSKTGSSNHFYYGQNALTLSKSVHMNASKSNKPEVRKLIVTCSDSGGRVQQTLNDLFGGEVRHAVNGHVSKARPQLKHGKGSTPGLELAFLDPLLADEKC